MTIAEAPHLAGPLSDEDLRLTHAMLTSRAELVRYALDRGPLDD